MIIVTRHAGVVEWLRRRGIQGEVIPHVGNSEQVRGKVVIGNLPLHLAASAAEVWAVELPALPPEWRGKELTAEEMEQAGARITKYRVQRLEEVK